MATLSTRRPTSDFGKHEDEELERRVMRFLRSRGIEGVENIHADVNRNTVTLQGHVSSRSVERVLVQCCARMPGVHHVVSELEVANPQKPR